MTAIPVSNNVPAVAAQSLPRLSPLSAVMVAGLAAIGAVYAYIVVALDAPAFLFIGTAIAAALIGVTLIGKRWTALPAIALVTVNLVMEARNITAWHMHNVEHGQDFATNVVIVPIASVAVIAAGIAYTVQRYRGGSLGLPRLAQVAAVLAVGGAIGGTVAAQAPHYGATARVSAAAIETLDTSLVMGDMKFLGDLEATAGEPVTWRIDNADNMAHSFDIPDMGIHMTIKPAESGMVFFVPDEKGTFTFKCSIPGHEKMKGTLTVK